MPTWGGEVWVCKEKLKRSAENEKQNVDKCTFYLTWRGESGVD